MVHIHTAHRSMGTDLLQVDLDAKLSQSPYVYFDVWKQDAQFLVWSTVGFQ